jgi:hypothetical protein
MPRPRERGTGWQADCLDDGPFWDALAATLRPSQVKRLRRDMAAKAQFRIAHKWDRQPPRPHGIPRPAPRDDIVPGESILRNSTGEPVKETGKEGSARGRGQVKLAGGYGTRTPSALKALHKYGISGDIAHYGDERDASFANITTGRMLRALKDAAARICKNQTPPISERDIVLLPNGRWGARAWDENNETRASIHLLSPGMGLPPDYATFREALAARIQWAA